MATGPSSNEEEFQNTTFSADESGVDSASSSSSTSVIILEGDGENYPIGQLLESVSSTQDAVAVIGAEKKQLNKKIEKFGVKVKKLKYEIMEALVKMASDLTEQEKILKEQRDALNLMKAARLGEARKKVAELECEISGLKGKIEEVKLESKKYDGNHKALMEEISHASTPDELLFYDGDGETATAGINYGNYCVEEMENSSKNLASRN